MADWQDVETVGVGLDTVKKFRRKLGEGYRNDIDMSLLNHYSLCYVMMKTWLAILVIILANILLIEFLQALTLRSVVPLWFTSIRAP